MNKLERLRRHIEAMEPESRKSELVKIQMRILTRLLNQLTESPPGEMVTFFNTFWSRYLKFSRAVFGALGVEDLRRISAGLLGIDPGKAKPPRKNKTPRQLT